MLIIRCQCGGFAEKPLRVDNLNLSNIVTEKLRQFLSKLFVRHLLAALNAAQVASVDINSIRNLLQRQSMLYSC